MNISNDVDENPLHSDDWRQAAVSPRSIFGDHVWHLDIRAAGRRADQSIVKWNIRPSFNSRLTDDEVRSLLDSAKHFMWSLVYNPPSGRKRISPSTVQSKSESLITIVSWMASEGSYQFSSLKIESINSFRAWLLNRQGRSGASETRPQTRVSYLAILKDLYRQRHKLGDSLLTDPLPNETTFEAAGLTRESKGSIPFIPDDISIPMLQNALLWVEEYGHMVRVAEATRLAIWIPTKAERGNGEAARQTQLRLKRACLEAPDGGIFRTNLDVRSAVMNLMSACFVVIAGFVGMRVSEILALKTGAITYRSLGNTGRRQAYINSRVFKTSSDFDGHPEEWVAPQPVVEAVKRLESLNKIMRQELGNNLLFIVRNTQKEKVVPLTAQHINERVNQFAEQANLPLYKGSPWRFSSHQFRKTFARFVARKDQSQLLGLAQHFKHASVAMTARGYVGTDFDLHELIDEEGRKETAQALEGILSSRNLAGKMGERIVTRNSRFRGRAGQQVRRDYIDFIMRETDLGIHACDYGWCVFQPETAKCDGVLAPDAVNRSPSACLSCSNMVIEPRHQPYWEDRKNRNVALLDQANDLTKAVVNESIAQCDSVISKLKPGG